MLPRLIRFGPRKVELRVRLEARTEHEQIQAHRFLGKVFAELNEQLEAGAFSIVAETVDPGEGEVFRAVVRSELLPEPKIVSVRHSENE